MEWSRHALFWLCVTATLFPNVINEPLWTASMKPGSLVGDIKNILANELKNRIAGGIMTAMGGQSHMAGGGGGGGGGTMSSLVGGLLGGQMGHTSMGGQAGYQTAGPMSFLNQSMPGARFEDYLRGGMKMHATIAIDFSATNGGHQTMPTSLHYLNPQNYLNNYEEAIGSVVGIIEAYDWDQRFNVFGFGAAYPRQSGTVREHFNLNHDFSECMGVQGVLDAYRRALGDMEFGRPTRFAPIISEIVKSIRPFDQHNYYLLLILTAGQIEDMAMTEAIIAQASTLPLSIMIVGIGNGPFQFMVTLDNDVRGILKQNRKEKKKQSGYNNEYPGKPKKEKKNKYGPMGALSTMSSLGAEGALGVGGGMGGGLGSGLGMEMMRKHRDIVQFVVFNNFRNYGDSNVARVQFGQELLAELPFQVESYMRSNKFMPGTLDPNRPLPIAQPVPGQSAYSSGVPGSIPGQQSGYGQVHGIPGSIPGQQPGFGYGQVQPAMGTTYSPIYQQPTQTNFYSGTPAASPFSAQPSPYQNSAVNASQFSSSQNPYSPSLSGVTMPQWVVWHSLP